MTTTIVHLVRHGEVHNPEKILYGQLPGYRLSARGRSQAARTAASLRGHDVVHLVASPLQRAQETARPFSINLKLEVHTDAGLIEAGNQLEGLRVRGWRSQLWNPARWHLLRNPALPSWGEHYVDIAERMMDTIERARIEAEGHEAVLVSHQLPIVCVQRTIQGRRLAHNPADRQCDLASVTSLIFQDSNITDMYYTEPAWEM